MLKIKLILYVAVSFAVISVFAYQEWQATKLRKSLVIVSENNAKLKIVANSQQNTISTLTGQVGEIVERSEELQQKVTGLGAEKERRVQQLNAYRGGRLSNVALEKPELVEKRATSAFVGIMHEFATDD